MTKSPLPNFPENQFIWFQCLRLLLFPNIFVQPVIGRALRENWPSVMVFIKVEDNLRLLDCIVFQLLFMRDCVVRL